MVAGWMGPPTVARGLIFAGGLVYRGLTKPKLTERLRHATIVLHELV